MNNDVLTELRKPFHPSVIEFKPQATTKDGSKAMAIAYADPRAYMNRLDEICGMDWSVSYTPWGERIVCHLTISGVTRSSTGEGDAQSERSEIAGTAAEGQAFKRACTMFGLGRYLYEMPSMWVEYDKDAKQFAPQGKTKLEAMIVQHYRRATAGTEARTVNKATGEITTTTQEPPSADEAQSSGEPNPFHGDASDAKPPRVTKAEQARLHALGVSIYGSGKAWDDARHALISEITTGATTSANDLTPTECAKLIALMTMGQMGQQLYGEQWPKVSRHNAERISGDKAIDAKELTVEQLNKLIDGMKKLQAKRSQRPVAAGK